MTTRWDEVVRRDGPVATTPSPARRPGHVDAPSTVAVRAWLYGALAGPALERPISLMLPSEFTLGDFFRALRERCGDGFMERILDAEGNKYDSCRVFVDGNPVDDLDSLAHAGADPANVEVILVMGIEGG